MTKIEMAEAVGVPRQTLYNWEKNRPKLFKIIDMYFNMGMGEEMERLSKENEQLKEELEKLKSEK